MFSLTGRDNVISIFSKEGIKELSLLLLMCILLFCALRTVYRVLHGKIEITPALLSFLFVWNTLIQCLNAGGNTGRYYLIGIVPLFFVAAYYFAEDKSILQTGGFAKQIKILLVTIFLIMQSALSYQELFVYRDNNEFSSTVQSYHKICSFAETQNVEYVYLVTRNYCSEICRMIGIGSDIKYLYIDKELGEVQVRDYYMEYDHARVCTQSALLVADAERNSDMEYIGLFGESVEQIASIDHYDIYKFK